MRPYSYRVTVLTEEGSQAVFGAHTYGYADKLARTLAKNWPYGIKAWLSVENTGRVLKTYER